MFNALLKTKDGSKCMLTQKNLKLSRLRGEIVFFCVFFKRPRFMNDQLLNSSTVQNPRTGCGFCPASFQSMLGLFVPPQIHLPLEAFAAEVAAKRLESRVFPAVRDQVGALAERFPANLAFVRLLAWKKEIKLTGVIFYSC